MSSVDALIGAGSALAGGGFAYLGTSRDRRQRAEDAREDRNYASRREACLLLERQRARQLEVDAQLYNFQRFGGTMDNPDHSDLQSSEIDALVSLFLPDRIVDLLIDLNRRHEAFIKSVNAIDRADIGDDRINAVKALDTPFDYLKAGSNALRQALREEEQSR